MVAMRSPRPLKKLVTAAPIAVNAAPMVSVNDLPGGCACAVRCGPPAKATVLAWACCSATNRPCSFSSGSLTSSLELGDVLG